MMRTSRTVIGSLAICAALASAAATQAQSPSEYDAAADDPIKLCPGASHTLRFEHDVPAVPPALDVVFAFDLTGSMGGTVSILDETTRRVSGAQFGLVSFRDYPFSPYGGAGDWAYRVEQAVTSARGSVEAAIAGMTTGGGGDGAESYTRVTFEAAHPDNSMGWRSEARKVLIMFGDNYPHDDDLSEGGVPAPPGSPWVTGVPPTYLDPGRSGDTGSDIDTSDNIDWQETLIALRDSDISMIYVGNATSDTAPLIRHWENWGNRTAYGGTAVAKTTSVTLVDVLLDVISSSTGRIGELTIRTEPEALAGWVSSVPPAYRDEVITDTGKTFAFDVTVAPPVGAAAGDYRIDVVMVGDGAEYARKTVDIVIEECVTPSPPPSPTPTPTPTVTPSPTPSPTPPPTGCVCDIVHRLVRPAVIADALANPDRYRGWQELLDPGKPPSPMNPPRTCLAMQHMALDYHPLYNPPIWRIGCRTR